MDVPALVVVGEDDAIVPLAEAAALANALPDGRLRAIPQAGHVPPARAARCVRGGRGAFLDEVGA